MQISDILNEPESKITLEVELSGQVLYFPIVPIAVEGKLLLAEPIMAQEKPLSFKGKRQKMIWYRKEQKPVVWELVNATYMILSDKRKVHVIKPLTQPKEINRREDYRQYIGINGTVSIGRDEEGMEVFVKNISRSGFAFVIPDKIDNFMNHLVRLDFTDEDFNEEFTLHGIIVREEITEDNRHIYGCRINRQSVSMTRYLLIKQRDDLARKRRQMDYEQGKR